MIVIGLIAVIAFLSTLKLPRNEDYQLSNDNDRISLVFDYDIAPNEVEKIRKELFSVLVLLHLIDSKQYHDVVAQQLSNNVIAFYFPAKTFDNDKKTKITWLFQQYHDFYKKFVAKRKDRPVYTLSFDTNFSITAKMLDNELKSRQAKSAFQAAINPHIKHYEAVVTFTGPKVVKFNVDGLLLAHCALLVKGLPALNYVTLPLDDFIEKNHRDVNSTSVSILENVKLTDSSGQFDFAQHVAKAPNQYAMQIAPATQQSPPQQDPLVKTGAVYLVYDLIALDDFNPQRSIGKSCYSSLPDELEFTLDGIPDSALQHLLGYQVNLVVDREITRKTTDKINHEE